MQAHHGQHIIYRSKVAVGRHLEPPKMLGESENTGFDGKDPATIGIGKHTPVTYISIDYFRFS